MQLGIFWGCIGMIEGLATRMKHAFGGPMMIVATGGPASLYAGSTGMIDHTDRELTIRGLREVYERNRAA
jgi:type III pantothenate kinase